MADADRPDIQGQDVHGEDMAPARPLRMQPAPDRGWRIAWGVLLLIAGLVAVLMPAVAALATVLMLAWLLLFGGAAEIAYAIQTRHERGFDWKIISAVLTLILGIAILLMPLAGIASLALLIGAFLLLGGVARVLWAFQQRPQSGWGWVLADGILSIVLAGLIVLGWPDSSVAFIGLLTGLWLIWAGLWRIVVPGPAVARQM